MSVFNRIGRFFAGAGRNVARGLKVIFGAAAAKKFADATVDLLKTAVGQIAINAVSYAEAYRPALDGEAKRRIALEELQHGLTQSKRDIGSGVKNLLIELAVNFIKSRIVQKVT
jgi:hypothetical protein